MALRRGSLTSLVHLYTAFDLLDYIRRQVQGSQSATSEATLKDAILEAYLEFPKLRNWNYLGAITRITTVAPYSTGTVTYDHTGGAYERLFTFSSGALPAGFDNGTIRINSVDYEIERRIDASRAVADSVFNPGADVAASSFVAFIDTYTLPPDFLYLDDPIYHNLCPGMTYVPPAAWLAAKRYSASQSGYAFTYTIMADPRRHNQWAMRMWPYPASARAIDIPYQRKPRPIVYFGTEDDSNAGTVVTDGTTAIAGTGTSFSEQMVGSVLRVANNTKNLPTGREGNVNFAAERIIESYTSATAIVTDSLVAQLNGGLGVKFRIADPIDLSDRMLVAFKRCVMKQASIVRYMRNQKEAEMAFEVALQDAADSDKLSKAPWNLGPQGAMVNIRGFDTGDDAGLM